MPRDEEILGTPVEWLSRAKADLALAKIPLPDGGRYEDLCYHAQQAAEKAIKAIFRMHGIRFTYTHNIGLLLDDLGERRIAIPEEAQRSARLTEYAHQTRYPGSVERVSESERDLAVKLAASVVAWAERVIAEAR